MPLKTIYVIRHGDRFDYNLGKENWAKLAQEKGLRQMDPVLSDKGRYQSVKLGHYFKDGPPSQGPKITRVLSSPFVRCLQTCNPIAGAANASICVENSLWECVYTSLELPPVSERVCYFPRIDVEYESLFKPVPDEEFPVANMERYGKAAVGIVNRCRETDEAIVICTHAAGVVAIVACLLKCKVCDFKPAAPASVFRLDVSENGVWALSVDGSVEHLGDDAVGETYPWPDPSNVPKDSWGAEFLKASETASWL